MSNHDIPLPSAATAIPEQLLNTASSERNPELLKEEATLRDMVINHGKKARRGQRTLEPAISLAEAPGIKYGLRSSKDTADKSGTKTFVTYRVDGSEVVKDLLVLQDGSVHSLDSSLVVSKYPVGDDDPTLVFLRQVSEKLRDKIDSDESSNQHRKHERRARFRKVIALTATASLAGTGVTAAVIGIYNKVTYDPEAAFDAKGVMLEQGITEIGSGESGPASFSNILYDDSALDIEDIPEAGDEISVNDGLRRITVSRVETWNSDVDKDGCSSVKVTGGSPDITLSAYTDVPPFPEGTSLVNTEVSLASHGKLVNACVVDWVPGTDQQTIVVDFHPENTAD